MNIIGVPQAKQFESALRTLETFEKNAKKAELAADRDFQRHGMTKKTALTYVEVAALWRKVAQQSALVHQLKAENLEMFANHTAT